MDDHKSAIVRFKNGFVWQGPVECVTIEYYNDTIYYDSLRYGPWHTGDIRFEATILDRGLTIIGDAATITFCKSELPNRFSDDMMTLPITESNHGD